MAPFPARRAVSLRDQVVEHKDTLLRGAALLLGGAALVVAGSLIGLGQGRAFSIVAGIIAVGGVVTMFLSFFLYVLPPLLPPR